MSTVPDSRLEFEEFAIDFAGRRLLRSGVEVALEPKGFDVLALLAGAPGQAFTRDQILDAVWGHRHVTPGVLNRIMTLLRHALGEDAQTPRYLHTLHGVGYRFDLPTAPAEATPLLPIESQPVPAGRELRRPGLAAASIVVLALALALGLGWKLRIAKVVPASPPAATPIAPVGAESPIVRNPTLIVMPLKAIGGTDSDREIAAGLSDELITELARVPALRVIARESTSLAAAQSADIAALVPRLQISHALEGSLRQSGEQLRVHMRLTEAATGRTLWAQDYDRRAAEVLVLQRDIARAVAVALALKLGLSSGPTAEGGDAAFLRRYFAARNQLRLGTPGLNIERIEAEFRALVRQRPEHARSHAGLALALDVRAFRNPALADQLRAEAAQEARIALELDPTLSDALLVQASAACRANLWESCLQRFESASQLGASESRPHYQYAMALAALGYLDRAERAMLESMKRDPLNNNLHFGYARVLDTLGRHDEAMAQHRLALPYSPYGRWFNAVWRKDLSGAAAIAESMASADAAGEYERILKPSYVAVSKALVDPRSWPDARLAIRKTERLSGLMNFLSVFDPDARPSQLVDGLQVVRERSYSSWDLLLWTKDLAFLRRDPAFQDYLRRTGILAYWKQSGFPPQCKPSGDGAICD